MKRVAILQSNYLPWKGYFDILGAVDEFIVYDCAQYTKNDWRNRNQLKTAQGKVWLTVPVRHRSLDQRIDEVEVADPRCFRKHWNTYRQAYGREPGFAAHEAVLAEAFATAAEFPRLSEVNLHFLKTVAGVLGIGTRITDARDYALPPGRNERLLALCRQAGATCYLSGPAARSYLDEEAFAREGIGVEWADYGGYEPYPQPYPPFDHYVSVLDLLACTGTRAPGYLKSAAMGRSAP
ncbi:MAG TPA: WbqC family protein [Xanthomonadaceae bacterium]|nr:WbqC family protein [Xanthomonadaceae bacterium]